MARVVCDFIEDGKIAILRMRFGNNSFNPDFIRDYNKALDSVERCCNKYDIYVAMLIILTAHLQ